MKPDLESIKKKNLKPVSVKPGNYKPVTITVSSILIIIAMWFIFMAINDAANKDLAPKRLIDIKHQVALDAEEQFYMAQRQGDKMQVYVQAGMVATAYLQAKDEVNYDKWKTVQDSCAHTVGLK